MAEEKGFEKPTFTLTPILNPDTKEYSLKHFEEVKEACEGFIEENTILTIYTDQDLKTLRECRTAIRKKKDLIKKTRLALTKLFSWQFQELEALLGDADNQLKVIKEEYEAKKLAEQIETVELPLPEENEPLKEVTIIIKYRDANVIEQLKKMAVDSGCEIIEIKEKK